jgi:hypothetical protein
VTNRSIGEGAVSRAVAACAIACALAACAKPRNNSSYATATAPRDAVVAIVATDSVHVAPDTIPAGMTHVAFENRGTTIHEVMFVKLPEGMSPAGYAAAVAAGSDFPEGALDCSGIGLTSPGERAEAWLELDPGNYVLVCWFNGHAMTTSRSVVVHGARSRTVQPPREDVTIRLVDFRFDVAGTLGRGDNVLKIEPVGPSLHEMDIFRLDEGKTIDDLRAWRKGGNRGPAPARAVGGVLDSHELGRTVWLRRSFEPGRYVLWCGMDMVPDAGENDPHVTHADAGMFREFEIGE